MQSVNHSHHGIIGPWYEPCPVCHTERECSKGHHIYPERMSRACGAYVCLNCGEHKGLARCYCGWSASGGNGAQELAEMGENLDEDY